MQDPRQHPYIMTLRVPVEYREWLHRQANTNHRSMNAEVMACLDEVRSLRKANRADHAR